MEVAITASPPSPSPEFNFDSSCSSPYITAPSSPQRFPNFFFSAPASPAALYSAATAARKPETDFQFDFTGDRPLPAADELFAGGKILPTNPPEKPVSRKSLFPLSPRRRRSSAGSPATAAGDPGRGRSLSPIRVSDIILEQDDDDGGGGSPERRKPTVAAAIASIFSGVPVAGYRRRRWRLRDLFRSASEGRAAGKYAAEEAGSSSLRSPEAGGVGSGRRRGPMSAHEVHYVENRAAAEEMRRKTMLPYKQGLLGCLGLNQEISRGIGSMTRGRS